MYTMYTIYTIYIYICIIYTYYALYILFDHLAVCITVIMSVAVVFPTAFNTLIAFLFFILFSLLTRDGF